MNSAWPCKGTKTVDSYTLTLSEPAMGNISAASPGQAGIGQEKTGGDEAPPDANKNGWQ